MPAQPLQTEAFVLTRRPAAGSFQAFGLFSPEHGAMLALQRMPGKPAPGHVALDLFDEASLAMESANQGRTWFVREARLLCRAGGIGRSYEALRAASAFAAMIARNPVGPEGRVKVADLLRTVFGAFAGGGPPSAILFKGVYRFALEEGYPVKQDWLPSLPRELGAWAALLLRTSVAGLREKPIPEEVCDTLQRRLDEYLRDRTEILVD
jgi:hypothetical protein